MDRHGVLVFLIARRLLRGATAFAVLAGAFAIVWAPSDRSRLCSVQMILYSGCTFGALLATWIMVEAWSRRRLALAAIAVAAGAAAVLSFEATLAPLALIPLLLLLGGGAREPRRLAVWTVAARGFLAAGGLRAVMPLWTDPERVAYQAQGAPDYSPGPLAERTLKQLRRHLAPAVQLPPAERSWPVAPVALVLAGGVGLPWALASYLPFALNPHLHGAERMQFLSTPGVVGLLAASVVGVVSLFSPRARLPAVGLLGAWIVAGGVMRTAALQADWDSRSAYPDQQGRAVGHAVGAPEFLYETRFETTGVRSVPRLRRLMILGG